MTYNLIHTTFPASSRYLPEAVFLSDSYRSCLPKEEPRPAVVLSLGAAVDRSEAVAVREEGEGEEDGDGDAAVRGSIQLVSMTLSRCGPFWNI